MDALQGPEVACVSAAARQDLDMAQKQRIGIIGRGNVGKALQDGLGRAGHEVRATGKDPKEVHEVADWAESIILAVPYLQREDAFEEMGAACNGKCVVDVTNAIGVQGEFVGSAERSGAEDLQQRHPDVKVVKAFNTVFAQRMPNGHAQGEPLSLFVAGNDKASKEAVLSWGRQLGYDPIDAGGLENARWLESMGYLNIQLGYKVGLGTDVGFRYLHPHARSGSDQARPRQQQTGGHQGSGGPRGDDSQVLADRATQGPQGR